MDGFLTALGGAAGAGLIGLTTLWLSQRGETARLAQGQTFATQAALTADRRALRDRTASRLRELYQDVLTAAFAIAPDELGYYFRSAEVARSIGDYEDEIKAAVARANNVRSRLALEVDHPGDPILVVFISVLSLSEQYRTQVRAKMENPDGIPATELSRTRTDILTNIRSLEDACRKRLTELEAPIT